MQEWNKETSDGPESGRDEEPVCQAVSQGCDLELGLSR